MPTILQASDTHLSRSHPLFQFNFEVLLREIGRLQPDLVIYTGDLSLNGPDNPDDVVYAAEQLARTPAPYLALPGNHDIGLAPYGGASTQLITPERRAIYLDAFGYDRFNSLLGGWRIVGLNSQLMGSGLPAEDEQFAWLHEQLGASELPTAVFMHYPVFLHEPHDADVGLHALSIAARERLMSAFAQAGKVRLVCTGHLHQARSAMHDGIRYEWAPSSAFTIPGEALNHLGGQQVTGVLLHELSPDGVASRVVEPELMMQMDLRNWSKTTPHGYYQVVGQPWPVAGSRENVPA
ncbi:MAG TPA: metallophosphoesterase [Ramlibacter sp.]|nr:metallophosphoesterase [Ramlibacter sp.]